MQECKDRRRGMKNQKSTDTDSCEISYIRGEGDSAIIPLISNISKVPSLSLPRSCGAKSENDCAPRCFMCLLRCRSSRAPVY